MRTNHDVIREAFPEQAERIAELSRKEELEKEYDPLIDVNPGDLLSGLFTFGLTEEGHSYWYKLACTQGLLETWLYNATAFLAHQGEGQ